MSADTVDDLHYAEDLACRLLALSRAAVEAMKSVVDHATGVPEPVLHSLLMVTRELDAASAESYCRPTCQDGTCTDDCGCPSHPDGQPHNASRDEDQSDERVISHTIRVDVHEGTIRVDLPGDDDTAAWDDLTGPDGGLFNGTTIEPWGVDEENMDRADTALAEFGFRRVGAWSDEEYPTATIRRIRGQEVRECHTDSM